MATSLCIDLSPAPADPNSGEDDAIVDGDHVQKCRDTTLTIQCLSELTPLDMMDMSFGIADPTGSCVWLGAFLFMEMFSRDLCGATDVQKYWSRVRRTLFPTNCHAIELGAGTGMSGISLMAMSARGDETRNTIEKAESHLNNQRSGPSLIVLTDCNDDALELCRKNRDANIGCNIEHDETTGVHVKKLEWGVDNAINLFDSQKEKDTATQQIEGRMSASPKPLLPDTYDVVFATDVLYDLSSLVPLVATASDLLKESAYFILSHVPRASTESDEDDSSEPVDYWRRLEDIIIEEASNAGLSLAPFPPVDAHVTENMSAAIIESIIHEQNNGSSHMVLRPSLLPNILKESSSLSKKYSWQRMLDAGAADLVFQKS